MGDVKTQATKRLVIAEGARDVTDLPDDTYVKIEWLGGYPPGFSVTYCDVHGDDVGENSVRGSLEAYEADEEEMGDCEGAYVVARSRADKGWGPLLYDLAIDLAGHVGLMPDRKQLSKPAYAVWKHYYYNRGDIDKEPVDEGSCDLATALEYGGENPDPVIMSKYFRSGPAQTLLRLMNAGKKVEP